MLIKSQIFLFCSLEICLYGDYFQQIAELLLQEELKPEILRVVVLTVAQMARRSASLTALHVTYSLLKPLVDTTTDEAARYFVSQENIFIDLLFESASVSFILFN